MYIYIYIYTPICIYIYILFYNCHQWNITKEPHPPGRCPATLLVLLQPFGRGSQLAPEVSHHLHVPRGRNAGLMAPLDEMKWFPIHRGSLPSYHPFLDGIFHGYHLFFSMFLPVPCPESSGIFNKQKTSFMELLMSSREKHIKLCSMI